MPRPLTVALMSSAIGMAACAAEPVQPELRVMVKLSQPATDPDVIARQAARVAGTAVRYAAAISPQWHALALSCADAAGCEAAMQRLRADTNTYEAVQRDERKRALKP